MKKEIRVYVVDVVDSEIPTDTLDPNSEYFNEEKFMDESENQGSVYTLGRFQDMLNDGFYLDGCFVYFKEVEYND